MEETMCPVITILGKAIPMYGVCIVLGAVIAGGIAVLFLQKPYRACHEGYDVAAAATFAMVGVFVGGKALYLLVELPFIVKNWHEILQLPGGAWNLLFGGYVFYGGLLGALFMLWLYSRIAGVRFRPLLLNLTPVIPIAHGFGRLGCFMAGCCYGNEYHGPGAVVFAHPAGSAPAGVELFPVQLLEMALNFCLAAGLLRFHSKKPWSLSVVGWYLLCYASMRFGLEFLRGDAERGFFLGLSVSQWISVCLIPLSIFLTNCDVYNKMYGKIHTLFHEEVNMDTNTPNQYSKDGTATAILVLGILSIVVCAPCGIVALVLRANNISEISPEKQGMVKAGYICSIVGICLWVLGLIITIISAVAGVALFA